MSLREEQDVTTMTDFKERLWMARGRGFEVLVLARCKTGENVTVQEKYATKLKEKQYG